MIEDGVVARDHGVYHVRLEFDPLSPEAITLHRRQSRAAWQAAMDAEGWVVQVGGPMDEPPPPDYDNHRADCFITPPPCARCARCRRVENGPNGWGDNYVDE